MTLACWGGATPASGTEMLQLLHVVLLRYRRNIGFMQIYGVSIYSDSCGCPADVYSVNPTIDPQDDTVCNPLSPIPKLTPKPKPPTAEMSKNPQSVLPIMALATA